MKVIKSYAYNVVNPEPFEIPFPIVFELFSGNILLTEYTISEEGVVDYSFNPNTSEKMLTSITRPLTLNDIYFLFSTRVFPDRTPYTAMEMETFGVAEYQPYEIIRRTRGIMRGDKYWFRFDNENITYKHALEEHQAYYNAAYQKYNQAHEATKDENDASEGEEKCELTEKVMDIMDNHSRKAMSDEMISSLMNTLGEELDSEEADTSAVDTVPAPSETTAPASDDKMSEDAIAAMLAAAGGSSASEQEAPALPEPAVAAEETPAPQSATAPDSGEKMSEEAIAALLAGNQ